MCVVALRRLAVDGQVVLGGCGDHGGGDVSYPAIPNGEEIAEVGGGARSSTKAAASSTTPISTANPNRGPAAAGITDSASPVDPTTVKGSLSPFEVAWPPRCSSDIGGQLSSLSRGLVSL